MWEEEAEEGLEAAAVERPLGRKAGDQHGALFGELMQEVKHSAPGARLSARLRTAIERLSPEERRALCSRTRDGCAPLFVACRRGNLEAVEYLVHVCNAELEQRGMYEVPDERAVHCVTPLWCAAVAGQLAVLRALADAGAALDAGSDSGSTPVRSACFMTHFDVVRFLVARGADIRRPNHNGGTCLINSVQSVRLCAFLIDHGAEVDARDMQHKTALHYAIQEHRPETARLLLARGAEPRLASRAGDDALRTAALKGAHQIVSLLAARVRYGPARLADAYELLGATKLDEFNDLAACLAAWRRATALRHAEPEYVEKTPVLGPCAALGGAREWRSAGELEAAAGDADALRTQALLVAARVLGEAHKEHVFRLMYRGASYADSFRYQRCIDLWTRAFEIRLAKDTILYADTCHTACALTRLLLDARGAMPAPHGAAARLAALLLGGLPEGRAALRARPVFKKQADTFDRALRCLAHVLHLLHDTASTEDERAQVLETARRAVRLELVSAHTGDTLLHLACSRLTVVRSPFAAEAAPPLARAALARLLLAAGADARRRNNARATPLHVAVVPYNYCPDLVSALPCPPAGAALARLLLAAGADARRRNNARATPLHVAVVPYNYCPDLVSALPCPPAGAALARLLLAAGADARRRNNARATPLHVAVVPYNYCPDLVSALPCPPAGAALARLLLAAGADARRRNNARATPLHVAVVPYNYCPDLVSALPCPPAGAALARLLLAAGADARRRNNARATPLHVAVVPYNYCPDLVEVLLAGGAHLDQPNKFGDSARELLALNRGARVCPLRHVSLACLAARALLRLAPAAAAAAPRHLAEILDLHRP